MSKNISRSISLALTVEQSFVMAYRGLLKVRRTPEQLIDVTLQPILFTLMFAYLFGGAIAGSVHSYLPLIIPGILAQTILTGSVAIGVNLRDDMDKGVFDRFRSLPVARIAPLAGALMADAIRYVIVTVLTFAMGYIMGMRPHAGFIGVLEASGLVIFFAWCTSWIFAFFGVIAKTATGVQGISMIILFPLTFVSNAFVPVNTLPKPLKWFAEVNPVSHLVNAIRTLLENGKTGSDFWLSVIGALVIMTFFSFITVKAYIRKAA
jgi:daunorubicin/doxorubicin transport system permease protein